MNNTVDRPGRKTLWILGLVILFIPFTWYEHSKVVLGDEIYTLVNPNLLFLRNLYTWDSSFGFGLPNLNILSLPYTLINTVGTLFLPLGWFQKTLFGLSFSMSFLSFYAFLKALAPPKKGECFALIAGSLLYAFNPYSLMMFPWFSTYSFLFVFTPLLMRESVLYIGGERRLSKFIAYSFFLSAVASNIALFSVYVFIIITFLVAGCISYKKPLTRALPILLALTLTNMHWVLPLTKMYESLFAKARLYGSVLATSHFFKSPILNGIALQEFYFFELKDSEGNNYYSYSSYYGYVGKLCMIIILLFTIKTLFVKSVGLGSDCPKIKVFLIYFISLFILGVFLSKGGDPPFGEFFRHSLKTIWLLQMYRASDLKFPYMVMLSTSVLLYYTLLVQEEKRVSIPIKYLSRIVVSTALVLLTGPFLRGELFRKSNQVDIPDYWLKLAQYINNEASYFGRLLLYPPSKNPHEEYSWGYRGGLLPNSMVNVPTISNTPPYGNSLQEGRFPTISILYKYLEMLGDADNNQEAFSNFMTLAETFNVTHILYRSDMKGYSNRHLNKSVLDKLFRNDNFGHTNLYWLGKTPTPFQVKDAEKVTYVRESPTKYRLSFRLPDTVDTVSMVFLESFDKNWSLTDGENTIATSHDLVYKYANGWATDLKALCSNAIKCRAANGSIEVETFVEYLPQRYYALGLLIGCLTAVCYMVYPTFMKITKFAGVSPCRRTQNHANR